MRCRRSRTTPTPTPIVMIGEIGGDAEERAAEYIKANVTKPVVGYVAGFTAPEGKTMGHAGAIVSGSSGTAAAKKEALEAAGVKVGKTPSETAELMRRDHDQSVTQCRCGYQLLIDLEWALALPGRAPHTVFH